MASSSSSSCRASLTSLPVAVALIEFSHATKASASLPQTPAAGWPVPRTEGLSGGGAPVSCTKSQYRSAGTGLAQILGPGGGGEGAAHVARRLDAGD